MPWMCATEAKIGRISEEAVFYLMSRGLSEEDARALIVGGFAEPIAKELPVEYAVEMNNLIHLEMEKAGGLGLKGEPGTELNGFKHEPPAGSHLEPVRRQHRPQSGGAAGDPRRTTGARRTSPSPCPPGVGEAEERLHRLCRRAAWAQSRRCATCWKTPPSARALTVAEVPRR